MRTDTLPYSDGEKKKWLPLIHEALRSNNVAKAIAIFRERCKMSEQFMRRAIEKEAEFVRLVDRSKAIGSEHSRFGLTPRQALIYAALWGWKGDEPPCPFMSPVPKETILAWGQSYYSGKEEHLSIAFDALVAQWLFFEVCPKVFDPPVYYCKYDPEFLEELPAGNKYKKFWIEWQKEYDEEHGFKTWRNLGLCWGQGSQGGDSPLGPCLGTSCSWFGEESCNWDLKFNRKLYEDNRI